MNAQQEQFLRESVIPALRSGEYKQVEGVLHRAVSENDHRFCCLGVMCDIHNPDGWRVLEPHETNDTSDLAWGENRDTAMLPLEVQKLTGIPALGSFARVYGAERSAYPDTMSTLAKDALDRSNSLSILNDTGASFDDIADVIEFIIDHPDEIKFN